MITRLPIPGGWYGENLPTGEYVVSLFDQFAVQTHLGRFELARDLLYTRIANEPFRFCGQDHFGTQNYEVTNGVGRDVGPSFSVNSVIYQNGTLVQAVNSHQGYRFISDSGQLVTGDESMYDPVHQIHEYTDTDGFRIGQGHESGALVLCPDGTVRILEEGSCSFIRVNRLGERFAITVVKLQERQTILFWLDKSDLLQLPIYGLTGDETLPRIDRPIWVGWFQFNQTWVGPGNCQLAVRNHAGSTKIPLIVTDETEVSFTTSFPLGKFIASSSVTDIEQQAGRSKLRPIVYWDARRWPTLPSLPEDSWLCLQAYRRVDETASQFEADMRRVIENAGQRYKIALVCQQYTSNVGLTQDLKGCIPVYLRLARDYQQIVALLLFSGAGRATGLEDHKELIPIWQTVVNSVRLPIDREPGPIVNTSKEPNLSLPSLDTWINVEYPQLVAAYTEAQGHDPDHQWAAFQTYRRYMEPTIWTFAKMLAWEKSGGVSADPVPGDRGDL